MAVAVRNGDDGPRSRLSTQRMEPAARSASAQPALSLLLFRRMESASPTRPASSDGTCSKSRFRMARSGRLFQAAFPGRRIGHPREPISSFRFLPARAPGLWTGRRGSRDFPGGWATPEETIRNGLRMAGDSSSIAKWTVSADLCSRTPQGAVLSVLDSIQSGTTAWNVLVAGRAMDLLLT